MINKEIKFYINEVVYEDIMKLDMPFFWKLQIIASNCSMRPREGSIELTLEARG